MTKRGRDDAELDHILVFVAALVGHVEILQYLLGDEANEAYKAGTNSAGITQLRHAIESGSFQAVHEAILKVVATSSIRSLPLGASPLHFVVWEGSSYLFDILVAAGVDVNLRDNLGATPLAFIAGSGSYGTVDMLLRAGADANIPTFEGSTALHQAALGCQWENFELIFNARPGVSFSCPNGQEPVLYLAALYGELGIVNLLLERGAQVDEPFIEGGARKTPLYAAVGTEDLGVVRALLGSGAEVDGQILYSAALVGNLEIVTCLLEANFGAVTPFIEGGVKKNPLQAAVKLEDLEGVLALLGAGGVVDGPVLNLAVHKGNLGVVSALLAADPSAAQPFLEGGVMKSPLRQGKLNNLLYFAWYGSECPRCYAGSASHQL